MFLRQIYEPKIHMRMNQKLKIHFEFGDINTLIISLFVNNTEKQKDNKINETINHKISI